MMATQSAEPGSASVVAFPRQLSRARARRRRAIGRFKEALLAFSESPSTDNAIRYLAASRALRSPGTGGAESGGLPPAA
jgi:hypothetical protein